MDISVPFVSVYLPLSVVMFLEYAVWGAWMPVLAARLLGPLKMTGKQTGWIYATLPLACIVAPLVSGQLADSYFSIKWILGVCHVIGAVLLVLAARERSFGRLFAVMLAYSFCFAATLPLVNSILFDNVKDGATQGMVFLWAPVAWALAGYFLTGWRWIFKTEGEGSDCLYLGAILSVVMAICCFAVLPANELAQTGEMPILKTFSMLGNMNFLLFIVLSGVLAGMMQFYFLGTAQFMQDMGIPGKNVPASMAIAQAAQAITTFFFLGMAITMLGFKWTLVLGSGAWVLLYAIYLIEKPAWLIVISQALHGVAYVFFMIVGQIFAEAMAPESIRSSMQALIFVATTGVGLFLGTYFAGIVMDRASVEGKFQWRRVWIVPGAIMLAGMLALAVGFSDPPKEDQAPKEPAKEAAMAPVQLDAPSLAMADPSAARQR